MASSRFSYYPFGKAATLKSHFLGTQKHDRTKIARDIEWHKTNPDGRRATEQPMTQPGKHRKASFQNGLTNGN